MSVSEGGNSPPDKSNLNVGYVVLNYEGDNQNSSCSSEDENRDSNSNNHDNSPAKRLRKDLDDKNGSDLSEVSQPMAVDSPNEFNVTKKPNVKYDEFSMGPYEVYMEAKTSDNNLGNFHSLSLAKLVFGLKLDNMQKIVRKGRNRIGIIFKNFCSANHFVDRFQNDERYNVFIPYNKTTVKGIIRFVDIEFSEDDLVNNMFINVRGCNILNARRMNRRVKNGNDISYIPTTTVCLTLTGSVLPKEVVIYGLVFAVYPYLLPVIQCYNCYRFGHTKKLCRGKQRCGRCGQTPHPNNGCDIKCVHCNSGEHIATDRNCPEYSRQKRIKELMSFDNKTFYEANESIPPIIRQRKNEQEAFYLQNKHFPPITQNKETSNSYSAQERREAARFAHSGPSYSNVTREPRIRRPDLARENPYEREEINGCLVNPNGRASPPMTNTPIFNSAYYRNTPRDNLGEEYLPLQREDVLEKTLEDILRVASILPLQGRMSVLQYMTQLEDLNISIYSPTSNR